jgi:hypothetical protein
MQRTLGLLNLVLVAVLVITGCTKLSPQTELTTTQGTPDSQPDRDKSDSEPPSKVTVLPVPNGGIQPQALTERNGTMHLIYFKGDSGAGDLFYVRREAGQERFSEPIRVNSRPGSAIAIGSVRGGQLAIGKGGRIHVVWNDSGKETRDGVLYARLNDSGTAFEEQRNLLQNTKIMDGGCTVAADDAGNVCVAWHAIKAGDEPGEMNRKVWVARSSDEGKTFTPEAAAWAKPTGVCPCCSMRAFASKQGDVYALYRSATDDVGRDIYLLASMDQGKSFNGKVIHEWKVAY